MHENTKPHNNLIIIVKVKECFGSFWEKMGNLKNLVTMETKTVAHWWEGDRLEPSPKFQW